MWVREDALAYVEDLAFSSPLESAKGTASIRRKERFRCCRERTAGNLKGREKEREGVYVRVRSARSCGCCFVLLSFYKGCLYLCLGGVSFLKKVLELRVLGCRIRSLGSGMRGEA